MAQESMPLVDRVNSASVIVQIVASHLGLSDRDQVVQAFWDRLMQLDLVPRPQLTPLMDSRQAEQRNGIQISLRDADQVAWVVEDISDRLEADPVEIRLTATLGKARLQMQTDSAEELLGLLPTLDTLLPARQLFQARAELYALRGGEISPVEHANLEILRHRLSLDDDEAVAMINRALGPFLDKQAKLQKYREVLNAELELSAKRDRHAPLSETTWQELRKLYRGMGLNYEDVEPIDQEYIARIQAEVTRLQQEEEATRLQQETQMQADVMQQEIAEQVDHSDLYRQEFRAAIARTLYPSEFDRGRLEQARRLWEIDPEVARAIEREVTDDRYGPIETNSGLDYSRLRQLLWLEQWELADQETERLILSALSRDMRPIDPNVVLQFDRVDLQTMDTLWARYSRGRFGFRAQYQVYAEQEKRADDFLQVVGWQDAFGIANVNLLTRRKPYRDLQFSLDAPVGHLPTWRWATDSLEGGYAVSETVVDSFFLHLEKCMPVLQVVTPSSPADEDRR